MFLLISQSHKTLHLCIKVLFSHHPEMMIELLLPRHLRDLMKTKIVRVGLCKRKRNIDKIFPQPCNICNPGPARKGDHGFGGMDSNPTDLLILLYKMPE